MDRDPLVAFMSGTQQGFSVSSALRPIFGRVNPNFVPKRRLY
jgi:hypothetical protein